MIDIYTDASVKHGKAVTAFFIISESNFVGSGVNFYKHVDSSLQAEVLAIRDGLKYICDSEVKDNFYSLCSDSQLAMQLITEGSENAPKAIDSVCNEIRSLSDLLNLHYITIKGHQTNHNPNKVVDLICNFLNEG